MSQSAQSLYCLVSILVTPARLINLIRPMSDSFLHRPILLQFIPLDLSCQSEEEASRGLSPRCQGLLSTILASLIVGRRQLSTFLSPISVCFSVWTPSLILRGCPLGCDRGVIRKGCRHLHTPWLSSNDALSLRTLPGWSRSLRRGCLVRLARA